MPLDLIVDVQALGRSFHGKPVLQDVSLTLREGELLGIVGPDGAGKTTLLQMIAAILRPTAGECRVFGHDVVRDAGHVQAQVGYMSQGLSLYDKLSVTENLAFAADIRDVPAEAFEERKAELLAMAGLERFEGRHEGDLSGGMRKKLALCTILIHETRLLILDEPSLGVDPLSRRELWNILDRARAQGKAIIFATSYMDEADASDQVLLLREGRPLAMGTPAELRQRAQGKVYQLAAGIGFSEHALDASDDVISFQKVTARKYRFQTLAGRPPILENAVISPADPTMEDVFTVSSTDDAEYGAGISTARPALTDEISVESKGVTRRFGKFVAVDAVDMAIRKGEIIGLLGPNGAGKTTLIRILCGLLPPSEGQATLAGFDVARQSHEVRSRIGYVSQRFSLFTDMTPMENLRFFARAYGVHSREMDERIAMAARRAGLDALSDHLVGSLSSALRQRLALACAIVHRPLVLFLDEPTSGVDPLSRFHFWRLISTLAAEGVSIIVSTHYLEEATYCDRLGLMMDGRMIAMGTLEELRAQLGIDDSRVEGVFLGFIERERAKEMKS